MAVFMFILFIAMPVAEIALLIEFGGWAGTWTTILVILTTAFAGSMLLRRQSLSVMARTQTALNEGRAPVDEVADGACLLVAGAFLVTPGLITDALGFALFVPPFRRWLARSIFQQAVKKGRVHVATGGAARRPPPQGTGARPSPHPARGGPTVIDGEYEPVKPSDSDQPNVSASGDEDDGSHTEQPAHNTGRRSPSGWQTVPNTKSDK